MDPRIAFVGRLATSGWRPYFGWGGGTMLLLAYKFAFIDAPMAGITLPEGHFNGLNVALGLFLGAFVARTVDKHLARKAGVPDEPSPSGGLVNQAAIT